MDPLFQGYTRKANLQVGNDRLKIIHSKLHGVRITSDHALQRACYVDLLYEIGQP